MDGASESHPRTRPSDSLNIKVVFPREMSYVWTLLQTRVKGIEVRSDGGWGVTGDFIPSIRKPLEDLATPLLHGKAFCERFDGIPPIYTFSG